MCMHLYLYLACFEYRVFWMSEIISQVIQVVILDYQIDCPLHMGVAWTGWLWPHGCLMSVVILVFHTYYWCEIKLHIVVRMIATPLCRKMLHLFCMLFALCLQSEFVHIKLDWGVLEQIDSTFAWMYRQVGQKQVLLPLGWKYQRDRERETYQSVQCCRKHQNQPLPSLHKVSFIYITFQVLYSNL